MDGAHRRLHPVHAHVRLQVALGGERASADLAAERPFAGMRAIVHLQGTAARENFVADNALVGVVDLGVDVVDELLEFGGFRGFVHLDEALPRVVGAARTRH